MWARDQPYPQSFQLFTSLQSFTFFKKELMIFKFLFPSFLLFVDDGLFILQEKSCLKLNADLFSSYNIISSLFNRFRLVIKHNKSEFFHFSRATKNYNPQLLDLSPLDGSLPIPKNI